MTSSNVFRTLILPVMRRAVEVRRDLKAAAAHRHARDWRLDPGLQSVTFSTALNMRLKHHDDLFISFSQIRSRSQFRSICYETVVPCLQASA